MSTNGMRPIHPGEILREDFLDQWSKVYDAEVAASLADPRPNVSHEEVEQEAATRRAALMKSTAQGGSSERSI